MKKQIFAAAALAFAAAASFAQTPAAATPRIDQREANQQQRIGEGVASGQLTPHETVKLEREQVAIRATERHAKSDGVVTAQERAHITKMQNRASHHIKRQKHDAQHA